MGDALHDHGDRPRAGQREAKVRLSVAVHAAGPDPLMRSAGIRRKAMTAKATAIPPAAMNPREKASAALSVLRPALDPVPRPGREPASGDARPGHCQGWTAFAQVPARS